MSFPRKNWLKQLIGDIWSSGEAKSNLTYLTDELENRFAGTKGESQAARFIKDKFREYGLEKVCLEEFEFQGWGRGFTKFKIIDPVKKELPAISLPYSPPANLQKEILDLGDGLKEDFQGDV